MYKGKDPELIHLRGKRLLTATVQDIIFVGEREYILVTDSTGLAWYPWRYMFNHDIGPDGKPDHSGWQRAREALPPANPEWSDPRALDTADLAGMNMTDYQLEQMAEKFLGIKDWSAERQGKSMRRREMFEKVMAAVMNDERTQPPPEAD